MKKDSKKDSAVSPVIGTILLVAITVVLVAIISAVVMGMTGNVGTTHSIGATVTHVDGTDNMLVTITQAENGLIATGDNTVNVSVGSANGSDKFVAVGLPVNVSITDMKAGIDQDVVASVKLTDGTTQVVYKGKMNINRVGTP